jgi:hypothetical protein
LLHVYLYFAVQIVDPKVLTPEGEKAEPTWVYVVPIIAETKELV